jgi:hypothetical protein
MNDLTVDEHPGYHPPARSSASEAVSEGKRRVLLIVINNTVRTSTPTGMAIQFSCWSGWPAAGTQKWGQEGSFGITIRNNRNTNASVPFSLQWDMMTGHNLVEGNTSIASIFWWSQKNGYNTTHPMLFRGNSGQNGGTIALNCNQANCGNGKYFPNSTTLDCQRACGGSQSNIFM